MSEDLQIAEHIRELAKKKNAIILAHNYQNPEIQDMAHYTGDSLELARIAAKNDADIIVFCGVHFMAESAYILSPQKKVLLPDKSAGCPMADMADVDALVELKKEYPDAVVVTYINSTAAIKAESDVCCTSSNAVKIVQGVEGDTILFLPDKNLADYVQRFTDKKIIPWKGFCPTHEQYSAEELKKIREKHPDAVVMVHPECNREVVDLADEVLSTGQMVTFVKETDKRKIIVGTEKGMIHKLQSVAPDKEYILASKAFVCPNMKKITLEKVLKSLENEEPEIRVPEEIRIKALGSLTRMLELS